MVIFWVNDRFNKRELYNKKRKRLRNYIILNIIAFFIIIYIAYNHFNNNLIEKAKKDNWITLIKEVKAFKPSEDDIDKTLIHLAESREKYIESDSYIIDRATEFLKEHEGVRYTAYWDFKQRSICYGHSSKYWETKTLEECEIQLRQRVTTELERINRFADWLNSNQKIALISFYYNVGFRYDVMQYAKRWDHKSVTYLMSLYNVAWGKWNRGLQNRRYKEIEIYNS